jgi:hypothetical protein
MHHLQKAIVLVAVLVGAAAIPSTAMAGELELGVGKSVRTFDRFDTELHSEEKCEGPCAEQNPTGWETQGYHIAWWQGFCDELPFDESCKPFVEPAEFFGRTDVVGILEGKHTGELVLTVGVETEYSRNHKGEGRAECTINANPGRGTKAHSHFYIGRIPVSSSCPEPYPYLLDTLFSLPGESNSITWQENEGG